MVWGLEALTSLIGPFWESGLRGLHWRKSCISVKYGYGDGDWFTPLPRGNHGVGLWKYIAKESG